MLPKNIASPLLWLYYRNKSLYAPGDMCNHVYGCMYTKAKTSEQFIVFWDQNEQMRFIYLNKHDSQKVNIEQ